MSREILIVEFDGLLGHQPSFEALDELMQDFQGDVVLNLRSVTHINSPGFGYLVLCKRRLERHGGELVISEPGRFTRFLATVASDLLTVLDGDEDALAHLQGKRRITDRTPRRIRVVSAEGAGSEVPRIEEA